MIYSKTIFCTYFDKNYLLKGLCLLSSFFKYHPQCKFWVLCFDDYTLKIIKKLKIKGVVPIALADFEKDDPQLLVAKKSRSQVEYCWTATPCLPLYIFRRNMEIQKVVYLDADLFFYSKIDSAFEELGEKSIFTVEHRFSSGQKYRILTSGRFNVGFQIYRNNQESVACLGRWRKQCLAWCFKQLKEGKYGDQIYLDDWPKLYPNLVISQNLGIDAAPWNIHQYRLSKRDGKIYINSNELICYHFHQFEILGEDRFEYCFGHHLSNWVKKYIYEPYIKEIKKQILLWKKIDKDFKVVVSRKSNTNRLKEKLIRLFGPIYWQAMTAVKFR